MDVTNFFNYLEANSSVNKNIKKTDEEKLQINKEKNSSSKVSSSDDDSSDNEEGSCRKAPLELIGEFLHYIRTGNWLDAKKLCGMILIYEPKNSVALNFKSVIDERIQLNEEMESASEEETSSSEEDYEAEAKEDSFEESSSDEDNSELSSEDDKRDHLENPLCF